MNLLLERRFDSNLYLNLTKTRACKIITCETGTFEIRTCNIRTRNIRTRKFTEFNLEILNETKTRKTEL